MSIERTLNFTRARQRTRVATQRAVLIAGISVFALLSVPLWFDLFYFGLDLQRCALGQLCALQRQLAAGDDLWLSPFMGNGTPLFARPEAQVAYPLRWLTVPFTPDLGNSIAAIAHLAGGAAGTTWLLRTFRIRPTPASCFGAFFALSGMVVNLMYHCMYVIGAAWIPVLWASARIVLCQRRHVAGALGLSLALSLCLLGGEPQSAAIGCGLVMIEAVMKLLRAPRACREPLLIISLALIAGALVGLTPYWGTLAEAVLTRRAGTLNPQEALAWPLFLETIPAILWPGLFVQLFEPGILLWNYASDDANFLPWNPRLYLGPLFLLCMGLGWSGTRIRSAALVFIAGLLLSLGDQTPVFPLLLKVFPQLAIFRYPAKYLLVTALAAVVLAARGAASLRRGTNTRRRRFIAALVGILIFHGLALAALGLLSEEFRGLSDLVGPSTGVLPPLDEMLRGALIHASIPVAAALLLLWKLPTRAAFIPVLLALDVLIAAPTLLSAGPSLVDARSAAEPLAAVGDGTPPTTCVASSLLSHGYRIREAPDDRWGSILFLRKWLVPELQACDGVINPISYSSVTMSRISSELQRGVDDGDLCATRALGCRFLIDRGPRLQDSLAPILTAKEVVEGPAEDLAVRVYEVPDALPEAFIVEAPRFFQDEASVIDAVRTAETSGEVLSVLDDPVGAIAPASLRPSGPSVGEVTLTRPRTSEATLSVTGQGSAIVGLRTAFLVGWKAYQDGKRLPVIRSGGMHVAVLIEDVSQGPVELRYESPRLLPSLITCCIGILIGFLSILAARRIDSRTTRA